MLEELLKNENHLLIHEVFLNLLLHENVHCVFFELYYENVNDDVLFHHVDENESEHLIVKNFLSQIRQ